MDREDDPDKKIVWTQVRMVKRNGQGFSYNQRGIGLWTVIGGSALLVCFWVSFQYFSHEPFLAYYSGLGLCLCAIGFFASLHERGIEWSRFFLINFLFFFPFFSVSIYYQWFLIWLPYPAGDLYHIALWVGLGELTVLFLFYLQLGEWIDAFAAPSSSFSETEDTSLFSFSLLTGVNILINLSLMLLLSQYYAFLSSSDLFNRGAFYFPLFMLILSISVFPLLLV